MNFLEKALHNVIDRSHETPTNESVSQVVSNEAIQTRIASLEKLVEQGQQYEHDVVVKDALIQELRANIENAHESTDVSIFEKELHELLQQQQSAEMLESNLALLEKLTHTLEERAEESNQALAN
ncbi:hypothetical protein KC866_00810 [Patescibacteria group bacterium]|nr:hypothetical protein [Patescibacteria group bacterium]